MAWIRTVPIENAQGLLKRLYREATARAGKVFHINRVQSLLPGVLRVSTMLYQELMHKPRDTLTRAQREMIAVAVSQLNGCYY